MARINIEDSLFLDERFIYLASKIGRFEAGGQFLYATKLAQRYWKENKSLIPENIFKIAGFSDEIISSGLIEKKEEGYYLKGSEENFAWLLSKIENSKKGGEATKNKYLEKPKESLREPTDSPPTLTPSLTPTKNNINTMFDFESIWKKYPKKAGKEKSKKSFHKSVKTEQDYADINKALDNYLKTRSVREGYIQNGSTWFNDWTGYIEPENENFIEDLAISNISQKYSEDIFS